MKKLLFIDTETTSSDRHKCGVWQIGGVVECGKRIEEFLFECDIYEGDEISPSAFEVNGMSEEKIAKLPDPDKTYEQFIQLLNKYVDKFDKKDKFTVVAYGAEFDEEVLRHWFEKNDDDYFGSWTWHPWLCMMQQSAFFYQNERQEIQNFKLVTVANYLGVKIQEDKFHNALYDAQIARKIYYKLLSNIEK
jgi:DNA polymerase-3 subunit epsilon